MPHFFTAEDLSGCETVSIVGGDARHIALSLRMRVGESVTVSDRNARRYVCTLREIRPDAVTAAIQSAEKSLCEPPYRAVLYQALPKGDKMDLIVQKAVEYGVYAVVPVLSARCISRPDAQTMEKRLLRWNKIAREAAMQCGRDRLTQVLPCVSFAEALRQQKDGETLSLLCYEGERTVSLKAALRGFDACPAEIRFMVGSEGGFAEEEARMASDAGWLPVGLGARILRCESAPLYVLAALSYEFEL